MDSKDVLIFQFIATVFTLSFVALTIAVIRYMQGLSDARDKLILLVAGLDRGLEPVLADLREGAAHFREASEQLRDGTARVGQWAEQVGRLLHGTKSGAKGFWDILARTAGAFLKA